jgi:hypothetical protein
MVRTMSTTPAAQLARLRLQFPAWRIIRMQSGTFIASHRITGEVVSAHTLAQLETLFCLSGPQTGER